MSGLEQSSGGRDAAGAGTTSDAGAHEGLIVKAARYLFDQISSRFAEHGRYIVSASYCEVYQEQVYDLLQLSGRPLGLRHATAEDEFFVVGLLEVQCETLADVEAVLAEGNANRSRAAHDLNQDSSRSHSLLTLHVHREPPAGGRVKGKLVRQPGE